MLRSELAQDQSQAGFGGGRDFPETGILCGVLGLHPSCAGKPRCWDERSASGVCETRAAGEGAAAVGAGGSRLLVFPSRSSAAEAPGGKRGIRVVFTCHLDLRRCGLGPKRGFAVAGWDQRGGLPLRVGTKEGVCRCGLRPKRGFARVNLRPLD